MAESLPDELLIEIFSQPSIRPRIDSDEDEEPSLEQYTLYSASLVSTTFQRLSQPLLYKSIDARIRGGHRVLRLVQTLARRPDLARDVHELRLGSYYYSIDYRRREGTEWNAFTERATRILQRANLSHETVELLQGALSPPTGSRDIGLAMLMVMCPNLQAWEFQVRDTYPLTERVFFDAGAVSSGRRAPNSRPLQSLRELTVTNIQDESSAELAAVRPYINHPPLRMLRCTQFRLGDDMAGLTSPAERVELDKADVHTDRVHELFKIFPNLSDLRLRWGDHLVCYSPVRFDKIGRCLRASGAKLKKLYLNAEESYWISGDARMLLPPLGSLRRLEGLTDLSLQAIMLTGRRADPAMIPDMTGTGQGEPLTKILPFSLRVLEINSFNQWGEEEPETHHNSLPWSIDEHLAELLSDQRFSELHTIRMINRKTSGHALLANAGRLGWVAETGVDIEHSADEDYEERKEWLELRRLSTI